MKKYRTWEILKMLTENPELRFKGKTFIGRDTKVWFDKCTKCVEWKSNDGSEFKITKWMLQDAEWQLMKEPVDFITALKAYTEGKTIKSSIIINGVNDGSTYTLKECDRVEEWIGFIYDRTGSAITAREILEAKWYIED